MKCHNCDGQGEVQEYNFDDRIDAPMFNIVTCVYCNGTGELEDDGVTE